MSGRETGTSFKPDIGNSAGEFKPTKPGAVPLETSGVCCPSFRYEV